MLDGRETDAHPIPDDQPQAGASLGELIAFFLRKPSPLIIGGTALDRHRGPTAGSVSGAGGTW